MHDFVQAGSTRTCGPISFKFDEQIDNTIKLCNAKKIFGCREFKGISRNLVYLTKHMC